MATIISVCEREKRGGKMVGGAFTSFDFSQQHLFVYLFKQSRCVIGLLLQGIFLVRQRLKIIFNLTAMKP